MMTKRLESLPASVNGHPGPGQSMEKRWMRFVGRQANRQSWPARKLIQGLGKPDAVKPKGFQQIRIVLRELLRCGVFQWKGFEDRPVLERLPVPGSIKVVFKKNPMTT